MLAVCAVRFDADAPLDGLEIRRVLAPLPPREDWAVVTVRAASLNHHDLWTLRGVGVRPGRDPLVLGSDGAGLDEHGQRVLIHSVIGEEGHGTPPGAGLSILAEDYPGTFAEQVTVPRWNLLPIPPEFSFEEAACLPGSYLTAYRMLFDESGIRPGDTVLVHGAGGGVATALILLGTAAGLRMWVTSRTEAGRQKALQLGAEVVFPTGAPFPGQVDAVMETVGAATWRQSISSVKDGGVVALAGTTSGDNPLDLFLKDIAARGLRIHGVRLGCRRQLSDLIAFCVAKGIRPLIDTMFTLAEARNGFRRMEAGGIFGKVVFTVNP
ncbi:zinc-binding dehydrogenase [Streptomyces sp. G44]|uniref:zinc-binding dehydrogenase n=1 Tax=Streptomyces sp. G44 TaxID=2807632 RepID=UPI0019613E2C|nr:zinc-binding dehydrogenase [Streptomyces sp. G44]MBM7167515.1 zinc-binding dehydrogenase [Streptomyces sp. G44]